MSLPAMTAATYTSCWDQGCSMKVHSETRLETRALCYLNLCTGVSNLLLMTLPAVPVVTAGAPHCPIAAV